MNAKLNFDPKLWGPGFWFALHLSALRFPVNPTATDKKNYNNFIKKSIHYCMQKYSKAYNNYNFIDVYSSRLG